MEADARVGGKVEMAPLQQQVQVQSVGGGAALVLTPSMDNNLPQPLYMLGSGQVMTDEQLETLRRQISVYSTICQQLVEMHKASVSAQSSLAGIVVGQHPLSYDPLIGTPNHKTTARQRWTPSQSQLQILEKLFDQGNGTPNKQRIKEITIELSQHGQIAETNVYNWFQNRKARAKRKQQLVTPTNGESEDTDVDSPKEKKPKVDKDSGQENSNSGGRADTTSDGGGFEQKPTIIDHYESASSRAAGGYAQGGSQLSSLHNVMGDGVVDIVRTEESGRTLQPLHTGERYRLSTSLVEGVGGAAPMAPEGHTIQHLSNGLANGTMLRS
ncbi:protein MpHD6 [Marchantia polymorpha subsp. ruderalis]|uniref:Homeobox domain-containing protein n=2 Tax=Marchantia polymorpha TaxID=3197 RepID=A0AAF6AP32_MARPO|nr:hypothetical protein MARPO_0014s0060 [Marchantia polymorpha]BBM98202.1 hypothetical protein Mp_1g11660 [Marchantia polymorpha subsp. ruderalis]|eukprot:PTQ45519.1 hypothetical protein MARPO_0014s0060 [Marchantia polymorpha]